MFKYTVIGLVFEYMVCNPPIYSEFFSKYTDPPVIYIKFFLNILILHMISKDKFDGLNYLENRREPVLNPESDIKEFLFVIILSELHVKH